MHQGHHCSLRFHQRGKEGLCATGFIYKSSRGTAVTINSSSRPAAKQTQNKDAPRYSSHHEALTNFQAVARLSIAPFVFFIIVCVSFWVFCFGRCCCNCFGGWERTPKNICYGKSCCGNPRTNPGWKFRGYSPAGVWTNKILLVLCAVILL